MVAAAAFVGALASVSAVGCGDDVQGTGGSGGAICDGGVFDEDGNCVAKCDPAKCVEGNVCADNACRLPCDGHSECFPGSQACVPAIEDDTGRVINVCKDTGRLAAPAGAYPQGTYGTSCFFGEADCAVQLGCPNGLECDPNSCADCEIAADLCPTEDGVGCNFGRCASTGELCVYNTCNCALVSDGGEATPFTCISAGEGDAEGYCTHHDCSDDTQCPSGFLCSETRDPREICGTMKGNSNVCGGESLEDCVEPGQFNANGAEFFEGSLCLLRKTCLERESCSPCEHNLDCSWSEAQVCTQHAGANVCARVCTGAGDCLADEDCVPYNPAALVGEMPGFCAGAPGVPCALNEDCEGGSCLPVAGTCEASPRFDCAQDADCPTEGDVCAPRSVCVPKSGACDASDAAGDKFCFHCTKDSDCGGPETTMGCTEVSSGGVRACLDLSFSTACTVDADCPLAPSGKPGECLDEAEGVDPGSSLYQKCYFPFDDVEERFTCW
jgi:hypothetical protein